MTVKYPKRETVWVSYYNANHELLFIITSKPLRDCYYLYELVGGEFKKLGRAAIPTELEEKFKVYEKMTMQNV